MNEDLLFAYLQQDGDFIQWVIQYPILVERVVTALVTLHNLDGSPDVSDLLACRDAAQSMQMIAREGALRMWPRSYQSSMTGLLGQCCPSLARSPNDPGSLLSL